MSLSGTLVPRLFAEVEWAKSNLSTRPEAAGKAGDCRIAGPFSAVDCSIYHVGASIIAGVGVELSPPASLDNGLAIGLEIVIFRATPSASLTTGMAWVRRYSAPASVNLVRCRVMGVATGV